MGTAGAQGGAVALADSSGQVPLGRRRRDEVVGRRASHDRSVGRSGTWLARVCVALGASAVLFAVLAPSVDAAYARIEGTVTCDRQVRWVATASTDGTPSERTNNDVVVDYRADGSERWQPAGDPGAFDASNGFRFSGEFRLPDGVDVAQLRVTPRASWGPDEDGAPPGDPRFGRVELPAACATHPLVASVEPDCRTGSAAVVVRNVGDGPDRVRVSVDRVVARELELAPAGTASLEVPVLSGRDTTLRVAAGDFTLAERTVGGSCEPEDAEAVVLERCGPGDAVVLARTVSSSAELRIRVADELVHRSRTDVGVVVQRTLVLPEAAVPVDVEVELDGELASVATVGGCDGPSSGGGPCGGSRTPCASTEAADRGELPPVPPPPLQIELDPSTGLPVTGPWQRALVLLVGGVLLLVGGSAVLAGDRRRPVVSPLAVALAPYRQRWWQD